MTRALLVLLGACSLAAAPGGPDAGPIEGEWTLDARRGDRVQLSLHRAWRRGGSQGSWTWTDGFSRSDLRGLPADRNYRGTVSLALVRDAGTVRLEGRLDRGRGNGRFTFEPDAAFVAELKQAGYGDASDEDLIRLCAENLGRDWIEGMASPGSRGLSLDDLLRLHDNGVSADYVHAFRALGYESATVDDLVRLSDNDVSPAFARRARELHGPVTPDELIRLRVNGAE